MAKKKAKAAPAAEEKKGVPGKKTCKSCGASVGVRSRVCKCGHVFEKPAKTGATRQNRGAPDAKTVVAQMKRAEALSQLLGENWKEILDELDHVGGTAGARELLLYLSERDKEGGAD